MAEINWYFCSNCSVTGIATSQMKTTVATKKGYRLKKLSIETRMDSKLILPGTSSVGRAAVSAAEQGIGRVNPRKGREDRGLRELRKERFGGKVFDW